MESLRDALCAAFDQDSLDQMLRLRLDKDRAQLAGSGSLQTVVFKVIEASIHQGWQTDLISAALKYNPGSAALQQFCTENPDLVGRAEPVTTRPAPPDDLAVVADAVRRSQEAAALFNRMLRDATLATRLPDPARVRELTHIKGLINRIIGLQVRQQTFPMKIRTYVEHQTTENWYDVKDALAEIAGLVRDLMDSLGRFDGDFVAYHVEEFERLTESLYARAAAVRFLQTLDTPRGGADLAKLAAIADQYEGLIGALRESTGHLVRYVKERAEGSEQHS
jgi:hypothetical protein